PIATIQILLCPAVNPDRVWITASSQTCLRRLPCPGVGALPLKGREGSGAASAHRRELLCDRRQRDPDALVLKPFPSRGGWVGMVSMLICRLQRLPAAHREHHPHPALPLKGGREGRWPTLEGEGEQRCGFCMRQRCRSEPLL